MNDNNKQDPGLASSAKEADSPIVYNVTVKVQHGIANEWLQWMINEHAPKIIATNCFKKFTALKLLEHDDEEGITYTIQYFSDNRQNYQRYIDEYAERFRKESSDKWGNKFIAFRTVMEVVH